MAEGGMEMWHLWCGSYSNTISTTGTDFCQAWRPRGLSPCSTHDEPGVSHPSSDWECSQHLCKLQIWMSLAGMPRHKCTYIDSTLSCFNKFNWLCQQHRYNPGCSELLNHTGVLPINSAECSYIATFTCWCVYKFVMQQVYLHCICILG